MRQKTGDKNILWVLVAIGFLALPFLLFRKSPFKDWLLVFSIKGVYCSILDSLVVQQKRVSYPVRFLSKAFKTNILFDYLLYPVACIFYNQVTYHSKLFGILGKALLFSIPMTLLEFGFERKTNLITWKKWTWYHTFITLTLTYWADRGPMGLIRKVSNSSFVKSEPPDHEKH